ncbi:MAG: ATP-binding protein [Pseudomonadota bacterium]
MDHYSDKINKTVHRIASIVMSLKKLSHGNIDGDFEDIPIGDVLREVEAITRSKAAEVNSTIRFINEKSELEFHGNFTLVGQVLLNLIVNALQATEDLQERWVRVETLEQAGLLIVRVTDSGAGISRELSKKIFTQFFTTKEVGKGTGLGLSLCKTAIERMNGHLYVDHDCKNTQFVIELPLSQRTLDSDHLEAA